MKEKEFIDQTLYNKLKPTDSPAPRFYGLPKIHKPTIPIRPIVSYTGTPLYNLSKYVADILTTYTKNPDKHTENSKQFSEYIRNVTIEEDEKLVSFDVTSLYTNVPIKDTLVIIRDLLENDENLNEKTKIPPSNLLEIIEFLLTKTWFIFDGKYYSQTDGVAMGGPASSVVAEIYMQKHEQIAISTADHPPKTWDRFVDDVLSIIKAEFLNEFFEHINNLHPKIKFTIEEEKDGCLAFLDTLIKRKENGELSVCVYRKPTHTDQYLNFHSNHIASTKDSVVSALFRRARDIISDPRELEKENNRIVNVLTANNYDKQTVMKVKRKIDNNGNAENRNDDIEQTEYVGQVVLPYIPKTSETLKRIFKTHNIRCSFQSKDTLRKALSKPKDIVEEERQNNIVYKIPCGDCPATYIGETKRSFETRAKEHARAVKNGDTNKNEIAMHCWTLGHKMNWDDKKVIDREKNWTARKIKETIHSIADNNHFNNVSYILPDIWKPALRN